MARLPAAGAFGIGRRTAALGFAVILAVILTWVLLLGVDGWRWLVWLLVSLLPAAAVWPLALRIFRGVGAVAFPFALALGPLLLAFSSWTLAYLRLLPFDSWALWLLLALVAAACWLPRSLRREVRSAWSAGRTRWGTGFFLVMFVIALGAWTYLRGFTPAIDGLEKFMDYGFMMSLSRTSFLPADDMWLAGEHINYYYFGQFVYTALCKMGLVTPAYGYNLSVASTFAYLATLAGAVGWQLSALRQRRTRGRGARVANVVAALTTAFFVALAGNSHSIFFASGAPLRGIVAWADAAGIASAQSTTWFYPDSTRFIGYNPETADKTIHEFPFYSFLAGDLHAHLVNTAFVLLFLGLLVQYCAGRAASARPLRITGTTGAAVGGTDDVPTLGSVSRGVVAAYRGLLLRPLPIVGSILLAVFMVGNYWDFVIYYVVLLVVALIFAIRARLRSPALSLLTFAFQQAVVLAPLVFLDDALTATLLMLVGSVLAALSLFVREDQLTRHGFLTAAMLSLAHVLVLPFTMQFEPIARSVAAAQAHTPLWQLVVLWGPQSLILAGGLVGFLYRGRRTGPRRTTDWLALALGVCACGLILVPELLYVVDIYENGFARANTMFKLTYQASILIGILMPYIVFSGWSRVARAFAGRTGDAPDRQRRSSRKVIGALVLVGATMILIAPAWYPFTSAPQAVPSLNPADYRGLDGAQWMRDAAPSTVTIGTTAYTETMSDDAAAIDWLNSEIAGQPVIIEAAGVPYTHLGRVSAYTGLPTVLGWDGHEWLWRTSASTPNAYEEIVAPRIRQIEEFYTAPDVYAENFLDQYDIAYIILGRWELSRYPGIDPAKIEALGEVVFTSGETRVIRVR